MQKKGSGSRKKIIAALLACLLILFPTALAEAGGTDDLMSGAIGEPDILGVWRLTWLRMGNDRFSAQELGIDKVFDSREDHTVRGVYAEAIRDNGAAEEPWALDADQALVLVSGSPFLKVRREDGILFLLMDEEVSAEAAGDLPFASAEAE